MKGADPLKNGSAPSFIVSLTKGTVYPILFYPVLLR